LIVPHASQSRITIKATPQRWADAPVLFVTAPHCLHCGSIELQVTRSESNGDDSRTRKYICRRCNGKTKVCIELPESGKSEMGVATIDSP
jgi:hypothetical protein